MANASNHLRRHMCGPLLFITLLCSACSSCENRPLSQATPTSAEVIESVRQALDRVGAYEAELATRVDSAAAFAQTGAPGFAVITYAHLKVRPPSQAWLSMRVSEEDSSEMLSNEEPMVMLFDGETIWTRGMRLDQRRLAWSEHALDSKFQISGIGLRSRKDLVDTVRSYLDDYTFEPNVTMQSDENGTVQQLVGETTVDQAVTRLLSDPIRIAGFAALDSAPEDTRREMMSALVDMAAASLNAARHLILSIDPATSLPTRIVLGREGAAFDTRIERFDTQVVLADAVFTRSDQRNAVDQTDSYLARFESMTSPSAERTAELRTMLMEAVQRVIARENDPSPPEDLEALEVLQPDYGD